MAFSDLINKPIATPLEGLDKSIATGVELANSQYRTQIAMEQNKLAREQLNASFIDKATGLLPHLTKVTGKAKGILVRSYSDLMAKAGMPVSEDLQALLSSDENVAANFAQNIQMLSKKYPPGTPDRDRLIHAELGELTGQSASDIYSGQLSLTKLQQSGQLQKELMFSREGQVSQRQKAQFERGVFSDISNDLNKRGADTQKEVDTLIRNTAMVEAAVKKNSLSAFNKTLGQQAKTSGTVGALSDYETRLQAPSGIPVLFAEATRFVKGDADIPGYVKKQVKEQISEMKKTASDLATGRNIGLISDRLSDPRSGPAYSVSQDKSGKLQLGFAAARIINSNNRILRALGQDKGTVNLNDYLKNQTVPMSSEQILKFIKSASTGGLLDRDTGKPSGERYIIEFSPNSIIKLSAPGAITEDGSYPEDSQQFQADMEGGE